MPLCTPYTGPLPISGTLLAHYRNVCWACSVIKTYIHKYLETFKQYIHTSLLREQQKKKVVFIWNMLQFVLER